MSSLTRAEIISQRCSGQYHATLTSLSNTIFSDADIPWVLTEKAQCLFFLQDFRALYSLVISSRHLLVPKSKEEALIEILYHFSRVHVDLALPEAAALAHDIYRTWLEQESSDEMEDIDISMLCCCHMIFNLEFLLLASDDGPVGELLSSVKLEALRIHLLKEKDVDHLALVLLADEKSTEPVERISKIQQALDIVPQDSKDMRVYLSTLLAKAVYGGGNDTATNLSLEILAGIQSGPLSSYNKERQLWARYSTAKFNSAAPKDILASAKVILAEFREIGDYYGALMCSVTVCKLEVLCGDIDSYRKTMSAVLKHSHELHIPDLEAAIKGSPIVLSDESPSYSTLDFWFQYTLHFLKEDMLSRERIGVAILCCNKFFQRHPESKIWQLRYTLSDSLSECYEEIGDMHQVLHWRGRGQDIAEEAGDTEMQEEAKYKMTLALSDESVKVLIDPYGVEQRKWEKTQTKDLELAWEQAQQKNQHWYQYSYALELLERELDDELRRNETPSGVVWSPRAKEALELLPLDIQRQKSIHYKCSMAYATFRSCQYEKSIGELTSVVLEARAIGNTEIESMAQFALARAHLHQFLDTKDSEDWEESRKAIEKCESDSESRNEIDIVALCHIIQAILWNAREPRARENLLVVLDHISKVAFLWDAEQSYLGAVETLGLESLMSKYSLRGRNEKNPYAVLGLAIDICYEIGDFRGAWKWVEYAKARAFVDSLDITSKNRGLSTESPKTAPDTTTTDEPVAFVHWAFVGEKVYILIDQTNMEPVMSKLDISVPDIETWYKDLVETREDYSEVESAEEVLSELAPLCEPLFDIIPEERLLVLCPTGVLFKIPLHAVPVGQNGKVLLDSHSIVYTHSMGVLAQCKKRALEIPNSRQSSSFKFFGNPTEDVPAGELSVRELSSQLGGEVYIRGEATRESFCSAFETSRVVHFHGHVAAAHHQLRNAMLFHGSEELEVRDVFSLELRKARPLVVLIGCGSGEERFYHGDEPLGFLSAFIYAGSPAVLGTMWPINDASGAEFSQMFYSDLSSTCTTEGTSSVQCIDLAHRLRRAALNIRKKPQTTAPYFWAGFVLYGFWEFQF
ncbi:hypothetical protein TWF718_000376 [Orbilia javanica]|uniref:CHAT domain-containing protein n=1 Tax=Orbilia javanica TaxID=47235 RepID=A0AAN8MX25_9PEZI